MAAQLDNKLVAAIAAMDVDAFNTAMENESGLSVIIQSVEVVHTLPQDQQDWWYEVMSPLVLAQAAAEVTPQQQEAGRAWSEYHHGDAEVLANAIQDFLRATEQGLLLNELVAKLEGVRPSLPHPDCDIEQVVAILLLDLLHQRVVWQTEDLRLHASTKPA